MANSYIFHSKLHRASHHTLSGTGLPDAGLDPIASESQPFIGVFYNVLPDNNNVLSIKTNSIEWWSTWSTVYTLSSIWAPTNSIYTTVSSFSANWQLGFSGYTTFNANSAAYESVYTTVKTYSGEWNSPFLMYTNVAQEYTAAKTFSGTNITYNIDTKFVSWDVSANQVTYLTLTDDDITFGPVINAKKGGVYILNIKQDSTGGHDITFDPSFRFNSTLNLNGVIALEPDSTTIITFVYDGILMYGHRATYYAP